MPNNNDDGSNDERVTIGSGQSWFDQEALRLSSYQYGRTVYTPIIPPISPGVVYNTAIDTSPVTTSRVYIDYDDWLRYAVNYHKSKLKPKKKKSHLPDWF
jgi:hypothetical protein